MKISFVTNHMGLGGAERVVSVLANKLAKMGYDVNLIVFEDKFEYVLDRNIKCNVVPFNNSNKVTKIVTKLKNYRKILKEINSDVIFSIGGITNMYTIFCSNGIKSKVVISERNDPTREPESKGLRMLRDVLYEKTDIIVFQTEDAKSYYSKNIQSKCTIIVNPLKEGLPERYTGIRKKEIVTGCRLEAQKNLKMLIASFKKFSDEFPDYVLTIYGDGTQREMLESYIRELGLCEKVRLPGFEPNIHDKMRDCSMYVSSSDFEGISNAMLEALAIGMPSVVTDCPVGGARMFIENEVNGLLVPVGDADAFYKAMKKIASNMEFSDMLSTNAVKIRERLNLEHICKQWLDLI